MKKAYKALSILMMVVMITITCTNVFAAINIADVSSNANLEGNLSTNMANAGSKVFTIVTNAGIILSVVIMAILGMKYMMGSAEDKSEYKKSMMPYLVGAVCLFGASSIAKIVMGFGKSLLVS